MPVKIKDDYPALKLAMSEDMYVVASKDIFYEDSSGLLLTDMDGLTVYEKGGTEYFVDKHLAKGDIESFFNAYDLMVKNTEK